MLVRVKPTFNQYHWGKLGCDSLVYNLQKKEKLDENERYSELWMGTHPKSPSTLFDSPQTLSDFLSSSNSAYTHLPFLFKVLSIDKPLSIQAHPDKQLAQTLHKNFPDIYKDDNHKPELACALTPFEALCGFRSKDEILEFLKETPELVDTLGGNDIISSCYDSSDEIFISHIFELLMEANPELVKQNVERLVERIKDDTLELHQVILYVHSHFPGDVGIFCIFLLNYVKLQAGEAIFLGPNLPHCYLSGNCIECMACSDNVVRAGLTPKLRDANTLCKMLDYTPKLHILQPEPLDMYCTRYPVPVDEFLLYSIIINEDLHKYSIPRPEKAPGLLLVVEGSASLHTPASPNIPTPLSFHMEEGSVFYIGDDISELLLTDIKTPAKIYFCTSK